MKPLHYIAIGCVVTALIVCAFVVGRATASVPDEGVIIRDTTVKVVTVYKDFPEPVKTYSVGYIPIPSYRFLVDTVTRETVMVCHDTTVVYLPREQRYYEEEDGMLRMWVSGVDPRLDRWELDRQTVTVRDTYRPPPKRWGLCVAAGYGITLSQQPQLAPYVGVGISYNIVTW